MTFPLDLQSDARRRPLILPIVVFWAGLVVIAVLCRLLHGQWWHFLIGILALVLVRVTTKWETL